MKRKYEILIILLGSFVKRDTKNSLPWHFLRLSHIPGRLLSLGREIGCRGHYTWSRIICKSFLRKNGWVAMLLLHNFTNIIRWSVCLGCGKSCRHLSESFRFGGKSGWWDSRRTQKGYSLALSGIWKLTIFGWQYTFAVFLRLSAKTCLWRLLLNNWWLDETWTLGRNSFARLLCSVHFGGPLSDLQFYSAVWLMCSFLMYILPDNVPMDLVFNNISL